MKQRRVAFWFGNDSEVRYIAQPPKAGDYVTHGREPWLVTRSGLDALGAFVVCRRPRRRNDRPPPEGELSDRAA